MNNGIVIFNNIMMSVKYTMYGHTTRKAVSSSDADMVARGIYVGIYVFHCECIYEPGLVMTEADFIFFI